MYFLYIFFVYFCIRMQEKQELEPNKLIGSEIWQYLVENGEGTKTRATHIGPHGDAVQAWRLDERGVGGVGRGWKCILRAQAVALGQSLGPKPRRMSICMPEACPSEARTIAKHQARRLFSSCNERPYACLQSFSWQTTDDIQVVILLVFEIGKLKLTLCIYL